MRRRGNERLAGASARWTLTASSDRTPAVRRIDLVDIHLDRKRVPVVKKGGIFTIHWRGGQGKCPAIHGVETEKH